MNYSETLKQVERERITEDKVRSMDASEVVGWIHELEDRIESLEKDAIGLSEIIHERHLSLERALPALEVLKTLIHKDDRHVVETVIKATQ